MMQPLGGVTEKDITLKGNLLAHQHIFKAEDIIWTAKRAKEKIEVIILLMK